MDYVAAVTSAVLAAIAGLHLFWVAGGRWGASAAVPEVAGKPAFQPGPAATLIVAGLLLVAATLVLLDAGLIALFWLPRWIPKAGTATLALVFLARAVGDFRRAGFFKPHQDTTFARLDTWLYSPLCLALALGCLSVALGCSAL